MRGPLGRSVGSAVRVTVGRTAPIGSTQRTRLAAPGRCHGLLLREHGAAGPDYLKASV